MRGSTLFFNSSCHSMQIKAPEKSLKKHSHRWDERVINVVQCLYYAFANAKSVYLEIDDVSLFFASTYIQAQ
jgi:hypothetical protein